jgi:hypothetical protein
MADLWLFTESVEREEVKGRWVREPRHMVFEVDKAKALEWLELMLKLDEFAPMTKQERARAEKCVNKFSTFRNLVNYKIEKIETGRVFRP